MKRKLIKRNKQFLSSRYKHNYNGNGSFQRIRVHKPFIDLHGDLQMRKPRYIWRWCFNAEWFSDLMGKVHD